MFRRFQPPHQKKGGQNGEQRGIIAISRASGLRNTTRKAQKMMLASARSSP